MSAKSALGRMSVRTVEGNMRASSRHEPGCSDRPKNPGAGGIFQNEPPLCRYGGIVPVFEKCAGGWRESGVALRYDDIGDRLKAFRLGSGLSADDIARLTGISRTALYRFEKGEVVKIETLDRLATLLQVSVATLLGVGVEYIASAVSYFERMRQIESTAQHVTVLASPIASILASDSFESTLEEVLHESIPADVEDRPRLLEDVTRITAILRERKANYRARQPTVLNLMSALEIERFARNGMVGNSGISEQLKRARRRLARTEVEHFAALIEEDPITVRIGIVSETLAHTGFQIFRQPDRQVLTISPFRLGEHPNVRVGVAMITSAPEALALYNTVVNQMWRSALKGNEAAQFLRGLLA
jgi:transcriptional regulator with XRE-family HTH domain